MNSPKADDAICFQDVSKVYKMYQSKWQMVRDALGFKIRQNVQEFNALKEINLSIKKGERIGLIGRNGAGKSTLLKLITGNFQPTSGAVLINGAVQALMNTGFGFHPEFSGLENIKASLLYNGLSKSELQAAIDDIVDFVELGEHLEQPFKTYSLGMQSRLQFAVSTAIQPEILIVDEVLGAGDAYFSAKSADRMKKLTSSGCTLLLVSHSNAQILQFCDKAIWIEQGGVVKEGPALEVVKLYEEFTKKMEHAVNSKAEDIKKERPGIIQSKWLMQKILQETISEKEPQNQKNLDSEFKGKLSEGGISRWQGNEEGIKITSFTILNSENKPCYLLQAGQSFTFQISFEASIAGHYPCYFSILILDKGGTPVTRHRSELFELQLESGKEYSINLIYSDLLLGTGDYVVSPSIFKDFGNESGESPRFYDLLSRSFEFSVNNFNDDPSKILHPARWLLTERDVHSKETQPEHSAS